MSRQNAKSRLDSQRSPEKDYKIFAINWHGSGLNSIREQFIQRARSGLRRRVFIVDLEEELKRESLLHEQRRATFEKNKIRKDQSLKPKDMLSLTLDAIQSCRHECDNIASTIAKEKEFNIYDYWMDDLAAIANKSGVRKKDLEKIPEKVRKTAKPLPVVKEFNGEELSKVCPEVKRRIHNKVGRPDELSKRKYIEDEPLNSKIFIILMGNLNTKLYNDLLSRSEPLQAIIHFLPEMSGYDVLIPHEETQMFLLRTLADIQEQFQDLRLLERTKPVGLFQQYLPVISRCLAAKLSQDIFNQLCWCLYDIDMVHEQYQLYYFQKFNVTNVSMASNVRVDDLLNTVEYRSLQGHYLHEALPAVGTDIGTISLYLESLLSSIEEPEGILSELEMQLLSTNGTRSSIHKQFSQINTLANLYRHAFNSITKVKNCNRLFIEQNNALLCSLILYTDKKFFRNIHHTCLEYSVLRRYIANNYLRGSIQSRPINEEREPYDLPKYVKLYVSADGVYQRLTKLLTDYDDYTVEELFSGYKLYCFKRTYNEIFEHEQLMILPSRLCFRDFTLFQMDEFLEDLITPEERQIITKTSVNKKMSNHSVELPDENIFIRKSSLWARKLNEEVKNTITSKELQTNTPQSKRDKRNRNFKIDETENQINQQKPNDFVGLPLGHHLLEGYNLDDVRQEIKVKTSKYYFEEGSVQLNEERWCGNIMNELLVLDIKRNQLHFNRPKTQTTGISNSLRLSTENDITVRIMAQKTDLANVVLNQPNGLSINCYETYIEQLWLVPQTFKGERQRVYTPNGAVIIHYNDNELISVLRYNGEVYQLYQHELGMDKEEEPYAEEIHAEVSTGTTSQSSSSETKIEVGKKRHKLKENVVEISIADSLINHMPAKPTKEEILESITNELKFLECISKDCELSYVHLKVTTSIGRVINITDSGIVYEDRPLDNLEWHDYFANESYAMRGDEVKRIWTKDALKCFHADGTIFTTKMEDSVEFSAYDGFDLDITDSSTHLKTESNDDSENTTEIIPPMVLTNSPLGVPLVELKDKVKNATKGNIGDTEPPRTIQNLYCPILMPENAEEYTQEMEYCAYVNYSCADYLMQHQSYASARFLTNIDNMLVEVSSVDDVLVQITKEAIVLSDEEEHKCFTVKDSLDKLNADSKDRGAEDFANHDMKSIIKLSINKCLDLSVTEEHCQIKAKLQRSDWNEEGTICDTLELKFRFELAITQFFHDLSGAISKLKKYSGKPMTELYFLERYGENKNIHGFEFYNALPPLQKYNFAAGNTITEFTPLPTMNEKMSNRYECFERDMKKFPKFPEKQKKCFENDFPLVVSTNVYIEIPHLLRSTEEIQKFLKPLGEVTFRKTRHQIKEALDFYLHPSLRSDLKILFSSRNWKLRHEAHRKRLFWEEQRKGLYKAMLKYNEYPKYYAFMKRFNGHVKYIDFFDFMAYRCMDNQ